MLRTAGSQIAQQQLPRPTLPDLPPCLLALVGTTWGLIFIATRTSRPEQKVRNFKKDVEKGKQFARKAASSRRKHAESEGESGGEEQPNWDVAREGPLPATDKTNGGRVSEDERTV